MDEREQSETSVLRELCEHPGWAVLMRNTQARLDAFRAGMPFNMKDEHALYFMHGTTATLMELLSLKERLEPSAPELADGDPEY